MLPNALASVIIVNYNGQRYLQDCLTSLIPELGERGEVILVDNASSDGSPEYIQQCWPQIRMIRNESNLGFAAACNQGAQAAQGEYFIFLNQDTHVLPGWLSGVLAPLGVDANIGLVTSKLLLMSRPGHIDMCGQDIHFAGLSARRGFLHPIESFSQPEIVGAVSGASFAIQRELWERMGGFNEDLFMYYEETDLSWRACLAGYKCLYTPDSVTYHNGSLRPSLDALYYSFRNRLILLVKHWKIPTLLLLLPSILITELVEWGYSLIFGWSGLWAKLRSYRWLIVHISKVLKARQSTQAGRKKPDWVLLKSCTYRLSPQIITGGLVGRTAIKLLNGFFTINYWVALHLTRRLNI